MGQLSEYDSLEQEIITGMGNQMQREIDREVLWGMLEGLGWVRVMLPSLKSNENAIDVVNWLKHNCKGPVEHAGRDFIFESSQDANWFKLRWL